MLYPSQDVTVSRIKNEGCDALLQNPKEWFNNNPVERQVKDTKIQLGELFFGEMVVVKS